MISTCGAPREPSFTLIVFSMTVSIIPGLALSVVSQKADPKIRKTTCPPPEPFAARTNYQDSAALRRVEIERVLQRATEAAQQGRLREALEVLNSVSSIADLPPAYFHLRETLEARTNQLELAEKDLRKALILAPRLSDAMYTLGLIELQQDKPGEAREWLSKSVDLNGQRPESWLALGQAYLHLKNAGLAENSFQAAIRLGHGAAPIYLGVGTAYQGQGNYEKAVPAFEHAVAVAGTDPAPRIALVRAIIKAGQKDRAAKLIDSWRGERMGSPSLHAELGIALAEAQLYSQAIREFETGLEEAPGSYDLQYNLALAYFYQERYDDCVTIARSLLQQTDNDQLHHLLGLVFERASQISAAAEEFRKAIALNPRVDDYYFHLGRLALQSGNYAEAERNFLAGRTVCVTRACVENLIGLGTAYSFEGKIGLAATTLEQAIQQDPRDYIPYVYLGDVLIKAGKFSKAEGPLKRALELKPDSGLAHYMYAYGLLKGNPQRVSDATASLREAIRLDPQNPLAYYRLGLIHSRAKEYSQAAALLEKAVALDTHLKEAHYQLGLAYQKLCKIELAGSEFRIIQALREKSLQAEELQRREIVRELNRLSSQ